MVCEGLVVEDKVLQSSFLDGLQDKAVGAVDRGDHFDRASLQGDSLFGTVSGADTAAQADRLVDDWSSFFGVIGVKGTVLLTTIMQGVKGTVPFDNQGTVPFDNLFLHGNGQADGSLKADDQFPGKRTLQSFHYAGAQNRAVF